MILNQNIISRLSLIKYLFQRAVDQSNQPSPQNYISVLMFHDSIELFLQLSAEFANANTTRNTKFMQYWDLINQELENQQLTQKESMRRLNRARIALKHDGIYPNPSDIESFRVNSENFFEENTPIVFNIEFNEISLVDLIENEVVKKILKDSQKLIQEEEFKESLELIAIAFEVLISDYEESKRSFGRSPFLIGESLSFLSGFTFDRTKDRDRHLSDVYKTTQAIQNVMKILCLNIDYRNYVRFRILTPDFIIPGQDFYDKYRVVWKGKREEREFNEQEAKYCFNFVINSALKLQQFDFEFEKKNEYAYHRSLF